MRRIPEPELMEGAAQAEAYAAADFSSTDQAMVERLLELFEGAPSSPGLGRRIVDLGCGPGNISFPLAAACRGATVLGIDGSPAMLAFAERRLQQQSCGERLRFRRIVLPCDSLAQLPLAGRFSAVVSNSLLHHLHDPQVLWQTVRQLAAPGAAVFVKDLRRPASPESLQSLVTRHAAEAPAVLRRDYANSLAAAFSVEEVRLQLRLARLDQLQVKAVDDRYLEVWGRTTAASQP